MFKELFTEAKSKDIKVTVLFFTHSSHGPEWLVKFPEGNDVKVTLLNTKETDFKRGDKIVLQNFEAVGMMGTSFQAKVKGK